MITLKNLHHLRHKSAKKYVQKRILNDARLNKVGIRERISSKKCPALLTTLSDNRNNNNNNI